MTSSTSPSNSSATLQSLPLDIFTEHLLSYLSYSSLVNLGSASKSLHANLSPPIIWQAFLRHKHYVDITQLKRLSLLPARLRASISCRADVGWEKHTFKSTSLFTQRWQQKCLPRLEITPDFIAVGVGADMQISWIRNAKWFAKDQDMKWMVYNLGKRGVQDITEIIPIPGVPTEFIVGQANGFIRHIKFSTEECKFSVERVFQHPWAIIRSLSITEQCLVALSSTSSNTHQISFYPLKRQDDGSSDAEICPIHTESPSRTEPWVSTEPVVQPDFTTSHPIRPWQGLFLSSSLLALGSTTPEALSIYDFCPNTSHPLQNPRELLSYAAKMSGADISLPTKTSVYAMHHYAPSLLLTGWYHGPANLHDLRLSTKYPIIAMDDPFDDSAAYSVSTDGAHRILVGGANYGMVKIFDVRMPSEGWSMYLGRERSPVYAVKGEHSRIFASTEGTVWECDLGFKHKPRRYDDEGNWRARMGKGGWFSRGEEYYGAQVRPHPMKTKLFREDGSEIGKVKTRGVALR